MTVMDINKVLAEYDTIQATHDHKAIEEFLLKSIDEAKNEGDKISVINLYNELIGLYREMARIDESIDCCKELLRMMDDVGLSGTPEYATILNNIANACRTAGRYKESLVYYDEALRIYDMRYAPDDYNYAYLYNNMALLFQDMGDTDSANDVLRKALEIARFNAKENPDAIVNVATTYTNIALAYLKKDDYDTATANMHKAFEIFDTLKKKDVQYSAALSAMAEIRYRAEDYAEAYEYYEKAMQEVKKLSGRNRTFKILLSNLRQCAARLREIEQEKNEVCVPEVKMNGLELSRAFYEEYGAPMIHSRFPEFEEKIAIGLVGECSEALGIADAEEFDPDFGPGFCMWVPDDIYKEIGTELAVYYDGLPLKYKGYSRLNTYNGNQKMGVFRTSGWYEALLGIRGIPERPIEWLYVGDSQLYKASNGEVFRDDLGEFTHNREEILKYYPEKPWRRKLANELKAVSAFGMKEYELAVKRGDAVTSRLCLAEFFEHVITLHFLMNRKYTPDYKWMYRIVKNEDPFIAEKIERLSSHMDDITTNMKLIDELIKYLFEELKEKGLVEGEDYRLELHVGEVLRGLA